MSAAPITTPVIPSVSLEAALQYAKSNNDLATVCKGLTEPINKQAFTSTLARIEIVSAAKRINGSNKKRAVWNAQQNRLKGLLFERIVGIILDSCTIFNPHQRVQTSTSELDWVVELRPFHIFVPVLRVWGTHFLCECKMSKKALDVNWVARLYALTQIHHTKIAVLFTAKEAGNRGNSSRATTSIREYSLIPSPAFILRITLSEMEDCVALEKSFLELVSNKYMQVAVKTDRLRMISN
jgi:hypothetical protein